jgi:UMF1 family MFS transporter
MTDRPDPQLTPPGPSQRSHVNLSGRALGSAGPVPKRRVLAWALWDWGTQPFNTVITTFVFSAYIVSSYFGETDANSQALGYSTAIAGFFIAALAPVLGQMGDRTGHTVRNLRLFTWALAAISAGLYFVAPEPQFFIMGLILLAVGTVICEVAGANYNSLLDRVATDQNVGKVSGFGWGMGYLGGIVVLLVILFLFVQPEITILGIPSANAMGIRLSMIVCGVWTILFTIPTFLSVKDRPPAPGRQEKVNLVQSYISLGRTIKKLWQSQRQTLYFLGASALFRDGLAGVFAFGAVLATGSFGFDFTEVIIFGAAANITAGVATIIVGLLDDKLGPKTVIMGSLVILAVSGLAAFFLHRPEYALFAGDPGFDAAASAQGKLIFWVCALLMSACVGPAQSASRSFLARLVPEGRSGEIFGLYATTGRVVSFLSPIMFSAMIGLGHILRGQSTGTQHWGILGIIVVLIAGLAVMIPVKPVSQHTTIGQEQR